LKSAIPKALSWDPILEAVAEIRFGPTAPSADELFVGMVYSEFKESFPKVENLPVSNVPREIRVQDPELMYRPHVRLSGPTGAIMLGPRVAAMTNQRPYLGWESFQPQALRLFSFLMGTGQLQKIERISVKYVNIVPFDKVPSDSKLIDADLYLGGHNLLDLPTTVRTEIEADGFVTVVQVLTKATAKSVSKEKFEGMILDIDTISRGAIDLSSGVLEQKLNHAHGLEKDLFFRILSRSAIESMGPTWV
jgi:uncharacterized protein (TIGR04255 family)